MKNEKIESPADFGKWFTAWLDDHAYVGVRKTELVEMMGRADRALDILRRLMESIDERDLAGAVFEENDDVSKKEIREVLK